jgi:hypothetical protein
MILKNMNQRARLVSALGQWSKGLWFESRIGELVQVRWASNQKVAGSTNPRLDSDYYLPHNQQLVRWYQYNVTTMLRCLWALLMHNFTYD